MRFIALLLLALLPACQRYKYELDLKPRGRDMDRSLVVTKANTDGRADAIPAEELQRLAEIYSTDFAGKPLTKASFAATFQRTMPQDIGGAGTHAAFETALGSFHIYAERFRGQDDLLLQWERQQAAADLLVDLSIGWADRTRKGEPGADKLHAFLDRDFRRDLKNTLLYVRWSGLDLTANGAKDQERAQFTEVAAMAAQYLLARGYFEVDDLPHLYNINIDDDAREWAMSLARRQLLTRMGRDPKGPLPPALAALNSSDAWRESIETFTKSDPEALARIKQWADARRPKKSDTTDDLLGAAACDLIPLRIFGSPDELDLRLHAPKPFATNGSWDAGIVTWHRSLEIEPEEMVGLPPTAVALWCEPDASAQTRLFGAIILTDSQLAGYCLERLVLPDVQASQWDRMLLAIKPETSPAVLRKFRFAGHEQGESAPAIAETLAVALESRPTERSDK